MGDRSAVALAKRGIGALVPVQIETIPGLLSGRDAVIEAPTGSGRTLAYLLPTVERLARPGPGLRSLVVTPVRELAMLVDAVFRGLGAAGGGRRPDAVVGTPGRSSTGSSAERWNSRAFGTWCWTRRTRCSTPVRARGRAPARADTAPTDDPGLRDDARLP